jgi:hypothetical protein
MVRPISEMPYMSHLSTREEVLIQAGNIRAKKQRMARRRLRFRLGIFSALVVALLLAGTAVARRGGNSAVDRALDMANIPATITVTIQPGDTLWSLARRYGNPRVSILDRVDSLVTENGFTEGVSLQPGQRVKVRVEHPEELARIRLAETRVAKADRTAKTTVR